ncbi:hypothetical protein [Rhizobium rhizogenes]|uniref:Uncharacterized protein n=1 Tax=Agrobacterium tumefaciens TaxID=358 RepID=K7WT88_AGRTU|nr:hypothetical protein [Rhizobium rhizogenes]AFX65707.1 Hypothetical protein [Agrobacterium radiobacter]WEO69822.1 hypothetical protein G6L54_033230 [Rhizobium rhizogenes]WEO69981.1 hypothetical protein G6L54_034000 [Rhizobium rhizogenes]
MAARLIVSATAPIALAFTTANIGATWSLAITTGVGTLAVLAFLGIGRLTRNQREGSLG